MRDRAFRRASRRLLPTSVHGRLVEAATGRRLAAVESRSAALSLAVARLRHPELVIHGGIEHHELQIYSQHGEDGILLWLFSTIGTTDRRFVEFGIQDGRECNARNLAEHWGWSGLMLDSDATGATSAAAFYSDLPVTVEHALVDPTNVRPILDRHHLSDEFDLLSIDIDSHDYWVWQAITARPRVVVIEYNPSLGPERAATVPYNPEFTYDQYVCGGTYHGASIAALSNLGTDKGYSLIGCETGGANAFFVRDDCVGGLAVISPAEAWHPNPNRRGTIDDQMAALARMPFVDL
jgi:hypothetical protein